MNPGTVFWRDQTAIGRHRTIVLSLETEDARVLVASITTYTGKRYQDTSCILTPADFDELIHDSWVKYDAAVLLDVEFVRKQPQCSSLAAEIVERVLHGAANTDRMEMGFQDLLASQGLI